MTQLYASTSNTKKAKSSKFDFLLNFEKAAEFQRLFCFVLVWRGMIEANKTCGLSHIISKKHKIAQPNSGLVTHWSDADRATGGVFAATRGRLIAPKYSSRSMQLRTKKGPAKSDPFFISMCRIYSRLPMNCSKNMNRLMKSRYSCNAPWIADLSNHSWSPWCACAIYVFLMFCVS